MTRQELLERLRALNDSNPELHIKADELLIEFIDDKDVAEAFDAIEKWYS